MPTQSELNQDLIKLLLPSEQIFIVQIRRKVDKNTKRKGQNII